MNKSIAISTALGIGIGAVLAIAQSPAPLPLRIDSQTATAPGIDVYRASPRTIRVVFSDGGEASDLTGYEPFMSWATNASASAVSTAAVSVVSATNGVVDFTFDGASINYAPGRYIYEVGVVSNGAAVYRQGTFTIRGSPFATGAGPVQWTETVNWATKINIGSPAFDSITLNGDTITNWSSVGVVTDTTLTGDGTGDSPLAVATGIVSGAAAGATALQPGDSITNLTGYGSAALAASNDFARSSVWGYDGTNATITATGGGIVGLGASSAGVGGIAIGYATTADDGGAAFGYATTAGIYGAAFGDATTADNYGAAFGYATTAGEVGAAFGYATTAGDSGFAAGYENVGGPGSFVYSDPGLTFDRSAITNGFSVRASGGTYFETPTFEVTGRFTGDAVGGDASRLPNVAGNAGLSDGELIAWKELPGQEDHGLYSVAWSEIAGRSGLGTTNDVTFARVTAAALGGAVTGQFATAAQGLLADSSVQPGDSIANESRPTAKIHILLMGQSNASGNAGDIPSDSYLEQIPGYDRVYANMHVDDTFTNLNGTLTIPLSEAVLTASKWGMEFSGARSLLALLPDTDIYFTKYTDGGTSLQGDWKKSVGTLYTNIATYVEETKASYPAAGDVDVIWWVQGESDTTESYAPLYYNNLTNFINDVRTDIGATNAAWVIAGLGAGYTSASAQIVTAAQQQAAADQANVEYVDMTDISTIDDNVHYDPAGLIRAGRKMAEATWRLYAQYRIDGGIATDNLSADRIAANRIAANEISADTLTWRGRNLKDDIRAHRPEAVSPSGLQAYYGEPQEGETAIRDWSKAGNHATFATNAPTWVFDTDAQRGAWELSGAGISRTDSCPTPISISAQTNVTIFARVKLLADVNSGAFPFFLGRRSSALGIGVGASPPSNYVWCQPMGASLNGTARKSLATNEYTHVCITMGSSGKSRIYIDGVLSRESYYTHHGQTGVLSFGTGYAGNRQQFRWTEAGVFFRELSGDEVERLANGAGIAGIASPDIEAGAALGSTSLQPNTAITPSSVTSTGVVAGGEIRSDLWYNAAGTDDNAKKWFAQWRGAERTTASTVAAADTSASTTTYIYDLPPTHRTIRALTLVASFATNDVVSAQYATNLQVRVGHGWVGSGGAGSGADQYVSFSEVAGEYNGAASGRRTARLELADAGVTRVVSAEGFFRPYLWVKNNGAEPLTNLTWVVRAEFVETE